MKKNKKPVSLFDLIVWDGIICRYADVIELLNKTEREQVRLATDNEAEIYILKHKK